MDPTEPVDVIHLSLAGFRRREQRRSRGCHVKQERAPLASADWSFWRVAWRRGRLIPLKWCAWTYTTAVLKGQTKELCNVKRKNMMKIFEQRRNTAAYVLLKRRFSKVQIQCVCPKFVLFLLLLLWFPAFLNVLFFWSALPAGLKLPSLVIIHPDGNLTPWRIIRHWGTLVHAGIFVRLLALRHLMHSGNAKTVNIILPRRGFCHLTMTLTVCCPVTCKCPRGGTIKLLLLLLWTFLLYWLFFPSQRKKRVSHSGQFK